MRHFILMAAILASTSICSQNASLKNRIDIEYNEFSTALDSLRVAQHIPGLAAAIVKDQELVWSKGFGSSHFDTGDGLEFKKVTPETPFWIASVTKTFVGLSFLQLEEEGIVNLNAFINDMPGWSEFCGWLSNSPIVFGKDLRCASEITIKNILNHTVNGEPGTQFLYNPLMYSRLSRYLEYVYGNPISAAETGHNKLAQHIEKRILGPAGMTRTMSSQWQSEKASVFFDMSDGYKYKDGRYRTLMAPERHLAGGAGIVSTVNDLAKYDIALDNGLLASDEVMKKLWSPATAPDGAELPYAFGWYVQQYNGENLIWHAGWDEEAGFTALYLKVPNENITLIILANSEGMWWGNPLDSAEVEQSLFAKLFLDIFLLND
ncbi:hypothetical protein FGF1_36590 [Flavobacteriaceae bacterium GF1]